MYNPSLFFLGYLSDHFLYKITSLKNIIDRYDEVKHVLLDGIQDIEDDKYLLSIRAELRASYFQAVETLYELLFALEKLPQQNGGKNLWLELSSITPQKQREHYGRIRNIGNGDVQFLDFKLGSVSYEDGDERDYSFGHYAFYYEMTNIDLREKIHDSLFAIKDFLVATAHDFSDRAEYNAYKHGLRILPVMKGFQLGNAETMQSLFQLDTSISLTYLQIENNPAALNISTRPLDSERDHQMTLICYFLISNIIRSRRLHFASNAIEPFYYITQQMVNDAAKPRVNWAGINVRLSSD